LKAVNVPTFVCEIFIAGNMHDIERECAHFCQDVGLCVSIEPTKFVYTGGREDGAVVRLVNYPRFPSQPAAIRDTARRLSERLLGACCQGSVLIVDHESTEWVTRRPVAQ
jgi:hypothetical protein